jgi:hypothetical protein
MSPYGQRQAGRVCVTAVADRCPVSLPLSCDNQQNEMNCLPHISEHQLSGFLIVPGQ